MIRSLLQGLGSFVAVALVFILSLNLGLSESDVRTLTFSTLIVVNLMLIVSNRSLTQPVWTAWRTPNPVLHWLAAGAFSLLAVILYVPLTRDLFRMSRPHADDAAAIFLVSLGTLVWLEIVKRVVPIGTRLAR